MAFGTMAKPAEQDVEIVRKKQKEAAVKCWFTAAGRAIPLSMKLQDENGEIFCVEEIYVKECQKKYYAGMVSWEYRCRICFGETPGGDPSVSAGNLPLETVSVDAGKRVCRGFRPVCTTG